MLCYATCYAMLLSCDVLIQLAHNVSGPPPLYESMPIPARHCLRMILRPREQGFITRCNTMADAASTAAVLISKLDRLSTILPHPMLKKLDILPLYPDAGPGINSSFLVDLRHAKPDERETGNFMSRLYICCM